LINLFAVCANSVEFYEPSLEQQLHNQPEPIVYAINCGGPLVVGNNGVMYMADENNHLMLASGGEVARTQTPISRVFPADLPLYQTERYGFETFSYDVQTPPDGKYTIVLRFSEIAFNEPGKKVFSVVLNDKHVIVRDLDIYTKAGANAAYDEFATFFIKGDSLKYKRKSTRVQDIMRISFVKGQHDNPKICAIVIVKGGSADANKIITQFFAMDEDPTSRIEPPKDLTGYVTNINGKGGDTSKANANAKRQKRPAASDEHTTPLLSLLLALGMIALITSMLGGDAAL